MKLGVIDVGGGFRDIYGAGVFDWCLTTMFILITVSAYRRAARIWHPFLAKQRGRNYFLYGLCVPQGIRKSG